MSGKTNIDELYTHKIDRDELLMQALERKVFQGKLRPEAVELLHELYGNKCQIIDNEITLLGKSMDDALDTVIAKMPLVRPVPGADPKIEAQKELEAQALAGSVTAHGQLYKELGAIGYEQWKRKHAALPGKPGSDKPADTPEPSTDADVQRAGGVNPWSKEGWSVTRQGAAYRLDPQLAERLAKSAGSHIGATRPAK